MMKTASMALASAMAIIPIGIAGAQIGPRHTPPTAEQTAAYHATPDTPGSGPYPALKEVRADLPGYVVYRPAQLNTLGKRKLAVVAWGNGGCSADGASARLHLAEIASHGYLVIAPGAVLSGPGAPPAVERARPQVDPVTGKLPPYPTKPADLTQAIDWALAENARPGSAFHDRIDSGKIAVAGHSCGGLQAMEAALDPRVKAAVIHNSGLFPDDVSPIRELRITKASLAGLRAPILYIVGGPTDNFTAFATDDFNRITAAPVMVASSPVGHHGTFREPNGGIAAAVATDWLDWQLFGDRTASKRFTGADCGLCGKADWTIMRKLERK